jgi:roadblock/LC7 domain-containing protein
MIKDILHWHPHWKIERYASEADRLAGKVYSPEEAMRLFGAPQVTEWKGNLLLNAGITVLLNLLGGIAATAFSNANAYIGVGDSSTAAAATQTNLQAATNKAYVAMNTGYPSVSSQTITFQATFGSAAGNYAWNEFIVANGSGGTTALNRVVSAQGTKASGQSWTVSLAITIS